MGIGPRKVMSEPDPAKIVGLTIHADRLADIRRARVRNLGANNRRYAELAEIYDELEVAAAVQRRLGRPGFKMPAPPILQTAERSLRAGEGREGRPPARRPR